MQKRAEPIKMPFGMLNGMSPGNHVLNKGAHWRNLVNTTEPSACGCGDAALRQIAMTTCRTTATTSNGVRSIGPSTSRYAHVPLTQSYVLQQEPGRPVARRTTRFLRPSGHSTSVQLASPLHRHLYHQSHTSIHTCTRRHRLSHSSEAMEPGQGF